MLSTLADVPGPNSHTNIEEIKRTECKISMMNIRTPRHWTRHIPAVNLVAVLARRSLASLYSTYWSLSLVDSLVMEERYKYEWLFVVLKVTNGIERTHYTT